MLSFTMFHNNNYIDSYLQIAILKVLLPFICTKHFYHVNMFMFVTQLQLSIHNNNEMNEVKMQKLERAMVSTLVVRSGQLRLTTSNK